MLEGLRNELVKQKGDFIYAKEFLHEAIMWLEYIGKLEFDHDHILNPDDDKRMFYSMFKLNSITLNYCALLNWMATVSLLKGTIGNREMAEFLSQSFKWPRHICETFINCVRNPSVHMGRAYQWGEYDAKWPQNEKQHGLDFIFTGAFDPNISSAKYRIPPQGHPAHEEVSTRVHEVGFFERQERTPRDLPKEMKVTFYYPAFKSLTAQTALKTFKKMKAFTPEEVIKFDEFRNKLNITRVPAPENMY